MVSVETVSIVFTGLSISLAAFYYISTLRNAQRIQQMQLETRQAQLFMQLSDTYVDKGYRSTALEMLSDKWSWADFDDFLNKYGPETNPEAWDKFQLQLSHWSRQGILVRDGLISAQTLWSWWGWVPLALWEKYEPIILGIRERYEAPPKGGLHSAFEDLYYSLLEERRKYRSDFIEKEAPLRAEKRKALGLKPIPPYL